MATWESELPKLEAIRDDSQGVVSALLDHLDEPQLLELLNCFGTEDEPITHLMAEGVSPWIMLRNLAHAAVAAEAVRRWDLRILEGATELDDPIEINW